MSFTIRIYELHDIFPAIIFEMIERQWTRDRGQDKEVMYGSSLHGVQSSELFLHRIVFFFLSFVSQER